MTRQREMVSLLLERGTSVNRRDVNGADALSVAASGGDRVIVRQILDAGADLDFEGRSGLRPVHIAPLGGQLELLA